MRGAIKVLISFDLVDWFWYPKRSYNKSYFTDFFFL